MGKDDIKTKRLYANIGKLITSSLKLDEILDGIMKEIQNYFDPQNWSLLRLDENTNKLYFSIYEGDMAEEISKISINPGEGIAGTVAETGESIFVHDTSKDPRFSDKIDKMSGFKTKSIIAVPLIFRGQVFGVIEIINRLNGEKFTNDEHLILRTIADFSAIAFSNAYLYEQVISQSITDPLTGLFNHTMLNSVIEEGELTNINNRRDSDPYTSMIIIYSDLDDFKSINDNYSHREGDRVLKSYARKLHKLFRKEDLLFRIGGDEFLAIVFYNKEKDPSEIMSRLSKEMSKIEISSKEKKYTVSISYGMSHGPAHNINQIIHEADKNMYNNKQGLKK